MSRRAEVADITRERYPRAHIPLHSRWRHLEAGGVDRKAELERCWRRCRTSAPAGDGGPHLRECAARCGRGPRLELRGAGHRPGLHALGGPGRGQLPRLQRGPVLQRSERPLQVDGPRCGRRWTAPRPFQVRDNNPLVGLEGRACCCGASAARSARPRGVRPRVRGPASSTIICRPRRTFRARRRSCTTSCSTS